MGRRKRYSAEFKREALRRATEAGITDVLVAEELGINPRQLRRWLDAVQRDGEEAFPGRLFVSERRWREDHPFVSVATSTTSP